MRGVGEVVRQELMLGIGSLRLLAHILLPASLGHVTTIYSNPS